MESFSESLVSTFRGHVSYPTVKFALLLLRTEKHKICLASASHASHICISLCIGYRTATHGDQAVADESCRCH